MEFGILGAVEIYINKHAERVRGTREQKLLAALLLRHGQMIPTHRLIDLLWEENPPATARLQVQNCLSNLRRQFDRFDSLQIVISRHVHGYTALIDSQALDLELFEQHMSAASSVLSCDQDIDGAAALYRKSLGLWRGPALGGLPGQLLEAEARRLNARRHTAIERFTEVETTLGRYDEALDCLANALAEDPLQERLTELYMVTLYRSGRRVESLRACRRFKDHLRDSEGLDPQDSLRQVEARILQNSFH